MVASTELSSTLHAALPAGMLSVSDAGMAALRRVAVPLLCLVLASPVLAAFCGLAYFVGLSLWRYVCANLLLTDPYSHLPAATHGSALMAPFVGDLGALHAEPDGVPLKRWLHEARSDVIVYRDFAYEPHLLLVDPRAMMHVLGAQNSAAFPKPARLRNFLTYVLGKGIITVEGETHRRQKKILQPAFNVSTVRALTPVFFKYGAHLARRLGRIADETHGPAERQAWPGQTDVSARASRAGAPVLDVAFWLARATMDIIGEAGFDWQFATIDQPLGAASDELAAAFRDSVEMEHPSAAYIVKCMLQHYPGFRWLQRFSTERERRVSAAYAVISRTCQKIIEQKRAHILEEARAAGAKQEQPPQPAARRDSDVAETSTDAFSQERLLSKHEWAEQRTQSAANGKDMLMLMMRSNMLADLKESERLSDAELLGQMTTLLFAGHETTATTVSWALKALASRPDAQDRLRAEVRDFMAGRDEVSFDELSSDGLSYLSAVIKETLRLYPPIPATVRCCAEDCVIPLSRAYPRRDGRGSFNSIAMRKGEDVIIHCFLVNTSEAIWGPDAMEFKPERWFDVPQAAKDSGFPLQLLSFVSGPRGCMGFQFALAEAKAILLKLILELRFERVPGWKIRPKHGVVLRSVVEGQEELGAQLPLRVSRV